MPQSLRKWLATSSCMLLWGYQCVAETVQVDLSNAQSPTTGIASGFLFTFTGDTDKPTESLVTPLNVKTHRGSGKWTFDSADQTKRLGISQQLIVSDGWGYDGEYPGDGGNWASWDAYVSNLVAQVRSKNIVLQYDIWNEPDHPTFWKRSVEQFYETWRRAYLWIRQSDSAAEIVGPSWSNVHPGDAAFTNFFYFAKTNHVVPDYVSWHFPRDVVAEAETARTFFSSAGTAIKGISINEYCNPSEQYVGRTAWLIAQLERAKIQSACHAIWGGDSDLDQTIMLTNREWMPKGQWWVYQQYAEIQGNVVQTTPSDGIDLVASINTNAKTAKILLGNRGLVTNNVSVILTNLSSSLVSATGTTHVLLHMIPENNNGVVTNLIMVTNRAFAVSNGQMSFSFPWASVRDAYSVTVGRSPFNGVRQQVPGTIEVQNFDHGGEGIAYHDFDSTNIGSVYRNEGVDIGSDWNGGFAIAWTTAGEWIDYSIEVLKSGNYEIVAYVASETNGGTFHIEVDGVNKTGALIAPNTGSWGNYQPVRKSGIYLDAGKHILRVVMDSNGPYGMGNINRIDLSSVPYIIKQPVSVSPFLGDEAIFSVSAAGSDSMSFQWMKNGGTLLGATNTCYTIPNVQDSDAGAFSVAISNSFGSIESADADLIVRKPFGGSRQTVPGRMLVENYDLAGEGFAFHDTTTNNISGLYRNDGVDIGSDGSGGYAVVWTEPGEWLEYSVSVQRSGYFAIIPSIASATNIGRFHLECDGVNLTGSILAPSTGDWLRFHPITLQPAIISGGNHIMRFVFENGWMNLQNIQFSDVSPFLSASVSNSSIQLSFSAIPNRTNILQTSTNLRDWADLHFFLPTSAAVSYEDTNRLSQRFYRVIIE
jgi:hypothetical protein